MHFFVLPVSFLRSVEISISCECFLAGNTPSLILRDKLCTRFLRVKEIGKWFDCLPCTPPTRQLFWTHFFFFVAEQMMAEHWLGFSTPFAQPKSLKPVSAAETAEHRIYITHPRSVLDNFFNLLLSFETPLNKDLSAVAYFLNSSLGCSDVLSIIPYFPWSGILTNLEYTLPRLIRERL